MGVRWPYTWDSYWPNVHALPSISFNAYKHSKSELFGYAHTCRLSGSVEKSAPNGVDFAAGLVRIFHNIPFHLGGSHAHKIVTEIRRVNIALHLLALPASTVSLGLSII